jgi:hypothetical protein
VARTLTRASHSTCLLVVFHGPFTPPAVVCGLNAFVAADNSCACNPNNVPVGDGVNCCRPNSAVVNGACACTGGYTWVDPACGEGAEALPFGFGNESAV